MVLKNVFIQWITCSLKGLKAIHQTRSSQEKYIYGIFENISGVRQYDLASSAYHIRMFCKLWETNSDLILNIFLNSYKIIYNRIAIRGVWRAAAALVDDVGRSFYMLHDSYRLCFVLVYSFSFSPSLHNGWKLRSMYCTLCTVYIVLRPIIYAAFYFLLTYRANRLVDFRSRYGTTRWALTPPDNRLVSSSRHIIII